MVTVAFSASSNCATGLPTMLERPITTASSPASERCTVLASMTQPSGVQGTRPGRPVASRPALTGWKPSTSLAGSMAAMHLLRIDLLRQRQLHQDAVHRWVGVELGDQRQQLGLLDVSGSW